VIPLRPAMKARLPLGKQPAGKEFQLGRKRSPEAEKTTYTGRWGALNPLFRNAILPEAARKPFRAAIWGA
jgi:hypothetical protein